MKIILHYLSSAVQGYYEKTPYDFNEIMQIKQPLLPLIVSDDLGVL